MRTPTILIALLSIASTLAAQGTRPSSKPMKALKLTKPAAAKPKSQDELAKLRSKKLAKPVFQHAEWLLDYDAARAKAKSEDKLLFVYFTRSYAP